MAPSDPMAEEMPAAAPLEPAASLDPAAPPAAYCPAPEVFGRASMMDLAHSTLYMCLYENFEANTTRNNSAKCKQTGTLARAAASATRLFGARAQQARDALGPGGRAVCAALEDPRACAAYLSAADLAATVGAEFRFCAVDRVDVSRGAMLVWLPGGARFLVGTRAARRVAAIVLCSNVVRAAMGVAGDFVAQSIRADQYVCQPYEIARYDADPRALPEAVADILIYADSIVRAAVPSPAS